jgi:Leucine-rich repeat (LRR) protein
MKHVQLNIANIQIFKILLFITVFIYNTTLRAEIANKTAAKSFAELVFNASLPRFAPGKGAKATALNSNLTLTYETKNATKTPVFVFQNASSGFAVVVQNNHQFALVGFAPTGNFNTDNIPPQLQVLIRMYEDSLQLKTNTAEKISVSTEAMTPLLDEAGVGLNQFNHKNVGNCPTGCVATAFAQIMAFYKYPAQGKGSNCYNHSTYGQICADFGNTFYNWNNPTDEDYSLLSFHVGVAMKMNYCADKYGSSPYEFGYEKAMNLNFKYYVHSGTTSLEYIQNELNHRRPVYIELPGAPGHALVADGYDSNGMLHLNFGWGGNYNGYFVLNSNTTFNVGYKFGTNISSAVYLSPTSLKTNVQDSLALVALNNSFNGTTSWDLTQPVFTWQGVLVMNERVIELNLNNGSYFTYKGSIPTEIGNLTALRTLNILGQLDGNLPSSIENLTELRIMSISGGNGTFKATLPTNIGNLTQLEYLSIPMKMEGTLPASLCRLTKLKYINLSLSELSGSIPNEISNLTQLETLDLHTNKLTGVIPSSIENLTNLVNLNLANNMLTGELPNNIGKLTKLENLYLNNNKITGNIPASIGNCKELKFLNLDNNTFEGAVPTTIGNLNLLESITLNSNRLTSIPNEIGRLQKITDLNLSDNQLKTLPESLIKIAGMKNFYASNNQISVLPENFGAWQNLLNINLSYNKISIFPEELCYVSNLQSIAFRNNKLELFPAASNFISPKIETILLDSNVIRGQIPETLLGNRKIQSLTLSYNRLQYEDIPNADTLYHRVGNQRPILLSKNIFKVALGDTVKINIKEYAPFQLINNTYFWCKYPELLNTAFTGLYLNDSILKVVIDVNTVKNKYYCKVLNANAPGYLFNFNASNYKLPCLEFIDTDTIGFQLATEEELIAEKYPDSHVIASNSIALKTIEDKIVTLVPPLKTRGIVSWQASADSKVWNELTSTMAQADLKANFVSVKNNELVLSPKTPAFYRCVLTDLNCEPIYSDTLKVNPFGKVLYDETINAATTAKTVKIDSIEVTIPPYLYDKDFRLTIVKLDNPPATPVGTKAGSAYDVTVSFGNVFKLPLLIKLKNVSTKNFDLKNIDKIKAGYFDEEKNQWVCYKNARISLKDSSLIFETNHLTKLSWWFDEDAVWGFTDVFVKNNIRVFYKADDVKAMEETYNPLQTAQTWHESETPIYIQDIAQYLSEVIADFKRRKLPVQPIFTVYVKEMPDADGEVGLMGMMNNYINIHRKIKGPVNLRSVLAHEYMHYTQASYIAAHTGNIFWMEANAHLADRMVWDESIISPSESDNYLLDGRSASESIYNFLSTSWDYWDKSFVTQNKWGNLKYCYLAGTFLHYMRSYRPENEKLEPDVLLKETSYLGSWRSYLNSYIQTYLKSNIGDEYEKYVKYVLEGGNKNFTILNTEGNPLSNIIANSTIKSKANFASKIVYRFDPNNLDPKKDTIDLDIPYLASKVFVLYNSTDDRAVIVNYKRLRSVTADNKIYFASYNADTKKMVYLDISDSTKYNFIMEPRNIETTAALKNQNFILMINKNNPGTIDTDSDFKAMFELTATPILEITSLLSAYVATKGNSLFIHTGSDGLKTAFVMSGARVNVSTTNLTYHTIFNNSSSKTVLNDSVYTVNANFSDETRYDYDKDNSGFYTNPSIQWINRNMFITYNFKTGDISMTTDSKIVNKYETIVDEKPKIILLSDWYDNYSLVLKNITDMKPNADGILFFITKNSAETQSVIKNMSHSNRTLNYNPDTGNVSSEKTTTYVSTDYSTDDVILVLMFNTK